MSQLNAPFDSQVDAPPPQVVKSWAPNPGLGLVACVAAAGLYYLVVNQIYPVVPREDLPEMGPYPSAELLAQYNAAEIAFQSANSAINGAILGALTGLFLGLMTAWKKILSSPVAAIAGGVAGAAGGYVAGLLVAGAINRTGAQSTVQSISFLLILWGAIAAAVCGALTALHNPKQTPVAMITGLVCAGIAAVVYNIAASLVFPMANLILLTPNTASEQLVWALSFGVVLGIGVAFGFRQPAAQPARS